MHKFLILAVLLIGCGKEPIKANPCATKGATYFQHYVEANNGTCGTIPDTIVNISADGTIPGDPPDCEAITQTGCKAQNTACKTTKNGVTCSATTSVTFEGDGTGAAGLVTMSCSGAAVCTSTYQVTLIRQ